MVENVDRQPSISVVVVVYNMAREAPRTLYSLSADYQRDIAPDDYEVIVVDNGSNPPFDPAVIEALSGNFRLIRIDHASPSPAQAVNRGLAEARGEVIGVMVDGARIATPGLLHFALHGARLYDRAVVATLGWYLGYDLQTWAIEAGYSKTREDALLASIDWPSDGYRLFEIGTMDESSVDGWLQPIAESNALFLRRESWELLGRLDERFDAPGGGLVNLDTFRRALEWPDAELVILLGEGTFHQLHGGISTNAPLENQHDNWTRWSSQYESISGRPYEVVRPRRAPAYIGTLTPTALARMVHSAIHSGSRSNYFEHPLGTDFDKDLWTSKRSPRSKDEVIAGLVDLADNEFLQGRFEASCAVARLIRQHAPDEHEPQRLLALLASWFAYDGRLPGDRIAGYHRALGEAYRLLGDRAAAASEYQKALTFEPDLKEAHDGLAMLGMSLDDCTRLEVTYELQALKRTDQGQYQASIRMQETMAERVRRTEDEVASVRAAYEAQLARQMEELSEVRAAYEKQIKELSNPRPVLETQPAELEIKHHADLLPQERSNYEAKLIRQKEEQKEEYEKQSAVIRARDESLASLQTQLAESEQEIGLLSAHLSAKAAEVDRITRSAGWRLLSRYGRLKYRYLLPIYRILGLRKGSGDERTTQLPPEHQAAAISQPPIVQSAHSAQELSEQPQLNPQYEILMHAPQQRAAVSSPIGELSQQMENAISEFQKRMDMDPSILDWDSGLELAVSFPHLAVFSPLSSERVEPTLPYLDHSIDIVVTSSPDPERIAEARRVASFAVILNDSLCTKLQHLTPRKVAEPRVSLGIEWLTDQGKAPSMPPTSIIIPVFNKANYTQSCLEQLSRTLPHDFNGEIVVIDDASSDETLALLEHWADTDERIKILRNPENVGFITSCNRGAESAQGDILIFLNNDTLPLSGWLPPLLRILREKPEAGAVGGRLVYPDGRLQEAGGVIFSDGSGCNFGWSDKAANAPLYNFVREVDYCSGALLATPRALFMELGGFDVRFKPAYYEDVDYCFSLREKGYRVYYQPESVIVHFEGASSGTDLNTGVKSYQVVNQQKFIAKWSEELKQHYPKPDQYDPYTLNILSRRNGSANGDGN